MNSLTKQELAPFLDALKKGASVHKNGDGTRSNSLKCWQSGTFLRIGSAHKDHLLTTSTDIVVNCRFMIAGPTKIDS